MPYFLFKSLPGISSQVGKHHQGGKVYRVGDVFFASGNLEKVMPNRFERLKTDDSRVLALMEDKDKAAPVAVAEPPPVEEDQDKDVTEMFAELANELAVKVVQTDDLFTIVDSKDGDLVEGPLKENQVESALENMLVAADEASDDAA